MVHTCPRCELRFTHASELLDHLSTDHNLDIGGFERFVYSGKRPQPQGVEGHRRYLVIANKTLASGELLQQIRELAGQGPASFYVVVPATHSEGAVDDTDDLGVALAKVRLQQMVDRLHGEGIDASGEVGHPDPFRAVDQVIRHEGAGYDAIIVSTLPAGLSRWLESDLVERLHRYAGLPVTTLTAAAH
jgi:hypothetical protein